jgi:hypothetical protein
MRFSDVRYGQLRRLLCYVVLMICALQCGPVSAQQPISQGGHGTCPAVSVRDAADAVLGAFQAKDGERLASLVHPDKGVRFSPSAFVNVDEDVVRSRDEMKAFWTDSKLYQWGFAEGSGDPITMTPAAYAERYIIDRDFSNATSVSINGDQAAGTTTNNAADVYPMATRVEYYIDPAVKQPAQINAWAAIRLVFENAQGCWLLIAIIHDEWSV